MEFLSALPGPLVTAAAVIGFIVTGVFALAAIFDKVRNQRIKDSDVADERLVQILQTTVGELEKKVKSLEEAHRLNQDMIVGLTAKNELLEKLFQGRDPETKEFQKAGFEAMKKADLLLTQNNTMNKNIERLAIAIEKHIDMTTVPTVMKEKTTKVTTVE